MWLCLWVVKDWIKGTIGVLLLFEYLLGEDTRNATVGRGGELCLWLRLGEVLP